MIAATSTVVAIRPLKVIGEANKEQHAQEIEIRPAGCGIPLVRGFRCLRIKCKGYGKQREAMTGVDTDDVLRKAPGKRFLVRNKKAHE